MSKNDQYLYRVDPTRPAMLTAGPTERETKTMGEHYSYLEGLVADGVVHMAGRTQETGERTFGIVVFSAASKAEARAVMLDDPGVKEGVLRAELFPYKIALWSPKPPVFDRL